MCTLRVKCSIFKKYEYFGMFLCKNVHIVYAKYTLGSMKQ